MTVRTLLTGVLTDAPARRIGQSGKSFTSAKARVADGQSTIWVNAIAFGSVGEMLAGLAAGDAVSISGRAEPKAWIDKAGAARATLDVVADGVLVIEREKRKPLQDAPQPAQHDANGATSAVDGDDIPF